MSRKTIRVLIVDDHAIVREGYRALLAKPEGITVDGEACDAASAYQCYKDKQPDVVIMDISMPGRGGIDAIKHIREFDAHARVLVFTMHSGVAYALQAFRAGAKGYVTKSNSTDVLVEAVKAVSDGRLAVCPEIDQVLASANYHYNIKSKLGVSSDIELLYFGLQHGVITPVAPLLDLEK